VFFPVHEESQSGSAPSQKNAVFLQSHLLEPHIITIFQLLLAQFIVRYHHTYASPHLEPLQSRHTQSAVDQTNSEALPGITLDSEGILAQWRETLGRIAKSWGLVSTLKAAVTQNSTNLKYQRL
jgi:hypothetical protein